MVAMLSSLKLEPKLLSLRVIQLYEVFHLVQNLGLESKGIRGCGTKHLTKMGYKKWVFSLFSTFITPLEKL